MNWKKLLIPALALLLDEWLGDPPNRWHPVAWLGSAIATVEKWLRRENPRQAFWSGVGVWVGGVALLGALMRGISALLSQGPRPLAILSEAALLKLTLSRRGLRQAALEIEKALQEGDIASARKQLAWHLVSRDTRELDAGQVAGATIESVAENNSDGILAPLVYYALGGVTFAWLYRFANTLDSMWGYHNERYEWLGKAAARLDDLLNWLPARLTAVFLILAAAWRGEDSRRALAILRRDARSTASPNAGFPMSAMAGALGVELEKVGHYRLGRGLRSPIAEDIPRAVALMQGAVLLGGAIIAIASELRPLPKKDP
jgi:adenosylcobinamide-phosphate synthase